MEDLGEEGGGLRIWDPGRLLLGVFEGGGGWVLLGSKFESNSGVGSEPRSQLVGASSHRREQLQGCLVSKKFSKNSLFI